MSTARRYDAPFGGPTRCRARGLEGRCYSKRTAADPVAWQAATDSTQTIDADWEFSPVTKRTFQPNNRRRHKTHGFRLRMRTRAGRAIVGARRRKGRARLAA
jgi:large subunit ribosomal protein L34